MKQTAVEFLHSEYKRIFGDVFVGVNKILELSDSLAQAKEMHKQEIIEAYQTFLDTTLEKKVYEQYYKETFKK